MARSRSQQAVARVSGAAKTRPTRADRRHGSGPCFGCIWRVCNARRAVVVSPRSVGERGHGCHNNTPNACSALVNSRAPPAIPLSDPTPPRLSSAIAIFTFRITFFVCALVAAGHFAEACGPICPSKPWHKISRAGTFDSLFPKACESAPASTTTTAPSSFRRVQHMSRNLALQ